MKGAQSHCRGFRFSLRFLILLLTVSALLLSVWRNRPTHLLTVDGGSQQTVTVNDDEIKTSD